MNSAQNRRLSALMKLQQGHLTMQQAQRCGLTASQVHHAVNSGRWECVGRGLYRAVGSAVSWQGRVWAACLEAGGWASHRTAGWLWGLDGVGGSAPRELEVIVALDNKCQAGGAKVRRSRTLLPSHVSKVRGPPRTNLARTLIDLSEQLDFEDLELAFGSAQRQQRDFREWLRRVMKPIPRRGHRGIANLDVLLEERDVAVDSALEVRVRRLLKSARLPMPVTGHPVFDDQVHVVRLDFAWPNNKPRVGLMAHGARWHNDTKRWKRDLKQVSRLSGMGWRVVQCTYDDVTKDSEQLLVDLRRALGGVVASGEHGEDVPI